MTKQKINKILKKVGAILTNDHFVYTSGKHGSVYINKDFLYPHTKETSQVCRMFARKFKDFPVDVVAAPAVGGTILCTWTAYHLSRLKKREVLSVYAEKDKGNRASASDGNLQFNRGYDAIIKGKNVLVLEDLTTTGISAKKTVDTVRSVGGKVVAVGVMLNRNPKEVNEILFRAPFFALGELPVEAYDEEDCPLCKKKIKINTKIGHGKKFLEKKR